MMGIPGLNKFPVLSFSYSQQGKHVIPPGVLLRNFQDSI